MIYTSHYDPIEAVKTINIPCPTSPFRGFSPWWFRWFLWSTAEQAWQRKNLDKFTCIGMLSASKWFQQENHPKSTEQCSKFLSHSIILLGSWWLSPIYCVDLSSIIHYTHQPTEVLNKWLMEFLEGGSPKREIFNLPSSAMVATVSRSQPDPQWCNLWPLDTSRLSRLP